MTVQTGYYGRFGNNVIQYCAARMFAERLGLHFGQPPPWPEILRVTPPKPGQRLKDGAGLRILRDSEDLHAQWSANQRYVLEGYFQQARYFENRANIQSFFDLEKVPVVSGDICVHLRAGDYATAFGSSRIIKPGWFEECLEKAKPFGRVFLVYNPKDDVGRFLDALHRFKPIHFEGKDWLADWNFMRQFRRLVISNSTFSWTAAYFGHCEKAWIFPRWLDLGHVQLQKVPWGDLSVSGKFEGEK